VISADSMSWSYTVRRDRPLPGHRHQLPRIRAAMANPGTRHRAAVATAGESRRLRSLALRTAPACGAWP